MLATTSAYNSAISASVRKIKAKVELYNGSTLVATYTQADKVISFDIQRVGEDGKFFGFGICHRLNVHLIDIQRELDISTANTIKISLGAELPDGTTEYKIYPTFQVSEVHRDENTNELSVTAYDAIYKASEHTVSELVLAKPYTIKQFVEACASVLGISVSGHTGFTLSYENGANFDGTETIREALDDVAEATQTIYYLDFNNTLCFKQLDKSGDAILSIDKSKYITLKSGVGRRLQTICMATELGDNVSESTTLVGSTQYVRDNAFWELRTDINTLVHNAITAIGDISIDVFDCTWRGNPALEIGDKISLTTKDNQTLIAYLLNDTVKYDGSLSEQTQWKYDTNNTETASNPTSLGDAIKQTYARVDKQQKQITLLVSEQEKNTTDIAQLKLDKNSINASVSTIVDTQADLSKTIVDMHNSLSQQNKNNADQFETLTQKVEATMTSDDVKLAISDELENGVDKVTTSTGFTFNEEGLTISKSDSEMSTNIDEDGMSIFKGSQEVLTANNTGVDAQNLHATTYLIIGTNSRFEDYGSDRTGCFWIGS